MKWHFTMLAGYNAWANRRLYDAAAELPDADYRADRGAFFGSVHRTLNHLIVGDRIWMGRFTGVPSSHKRLDEVPHDSFDALWAARQVEDDRIVGFVDGMGEEKLLGLFSYRTIANPGDVTQPL